MNDKIQRSEKIKTFKTILIKDGFKGQIHIDKANLLINATDNSIYEVMPLAVIAPFDSADLKKIVELGNQAEFDELYFCARGGGTGTNGQSLTDGIVIDFSRFMNRVLEFNPEAKTITVEPGMILSNLNQMLSKHNLFFAPNVSTADRATIGGMVATDAAGKGSLIYGKTSDHILGMELILADSTVIDTLNKKDQFTAAQTNVEDKISQLLAPIQEEINSRFPPLKRPLSGYNIKQCYTQNKVYLERLIAGSEGTLGMLGAVKLNLLPIPKFRALIVVHYDSFLRALKDAEFLIQFQPLAIEAVDEKVQKSAQSMPNWPALAKLLNSDGMSHISNFIEFVADSQTELDQKLTKIQEALDSRPANYVVIRENAQINQLWSIRSLAVGLVGKLPGAKKPVAFVEDAIVPPQNLADFVFDLQGELDRQNLNYAMYGHVDVGCIHVRPALDMQNPDDRAQIRPITETVIKLLKKYNGILWGEHGKGYRGEFVPEVFGPVLYPVICQIKALFDPKNKFNPLKLAAPSATTKLARIEHVQMRGELDQIIAKKDQKDFVGSILCNGNAACFNQDLANVMCPSYKITKDRIHSPKGRAMLVKEWLRERAKPNGEHKKAATDAYLALSGCLGCKGCSGKCPTQVSIPDLRTNFLEVYHQTYSRRNIRDLVLAYIENLIPFIAKFPKIWNYIEHLRIPQKFGINNVPVFKGGKSFKKNLKDNQVLLYNGLEQLKNLEKKSVVIFADVFTSFFDSSVLFSTIKVLRKLNFTPHIIYPRSSGKAMIVSGLKAKFKKNSDKLADLLNPLLESSIPVIGLENTITMMFRDEVNKFATPLSGKVLTIAEFLTNQLEQLPILNTVNKYCFLPHCTEQSLLPSEGQNWHKIFTKLGSQLEIKNLGCCGMAGNYGHLTENQKNSSGLYQMNWQTAVDNSELINLASGFSCRSQVDKLASKNLLHPILIIDKLLNDSDMPMPERHL